MRKEPWFSCIWQQNVYFSSTISFLIAILLLTRSFLFGIVNKLCLKRLFFCFTCCLQLTYSRVLPRIHFEKSWHVRFAVSGHSIPHSFQPKKTTIFSQGIFFISGLFLFQSRTTPIVLTSTIRESWHRNNPFRITFSKWFSMDCQSLALLQPATTECQGWCEVTLSYILPLRICSTSRTEKVILT